MTEFLIILQARLSSSRLPGKVLKKILDKPMLEHQLQRLSHIATPHQLIVATSEQADDDAIAALCQRLNVDCYRGSLDDVLGRYYHAALSVNSHNKIKHIIRLTGDCPLIDANIIDDVIALYLSNPVDYCSNCAPATLPDGLDVEIFSLAALKIAHQQATKPSEREHVTPFIRNTPQLFTQINYAYTTDLSHLRWTVDEPKDFELITKIYQALYPENPTFDLADILSLIEKNPLLTQINQHIKRNEGLIKSERIDKALLQPESKSGILMNRSYQKSNQWLERAKKTIPLGSQTFSKSHTAYPKKVSPLFIKRGQGCQVWDADENQYTDFVSGLLSVSLGYCNPEVDEAVINQIKSGVTFSLPHQLEMEVAEKIVELIPCADMVRFGKNGSDATSAAIRLARAFTKKEHVAVCGYHGWQDWYIGSTTRDLGVPQATKALTHVFKYNDISSLELIFSQQQDKVAAVILEPMNTHFPEDNFLSKVQALCKKNHAVLIFDETITGFRYNLGGAQAFFGVTPDLATFGKGMANGYPISAVTGRRDIMMLMEDIFFSGTFAGETLSLAATKATLIFMEKHDVVSHLSLMGEKLQAGLAEQIKQLHAEHWLSLSGHAAWSFLNIAAQGGYSVIELKSLFLQEMAKRGFLIGGGHNINYAHKSTDIDALLCAYKEVLPLLANTIKKQNFETIFKGELLEPVFKVR
jgi:glutamate-1-semialdehyde aminotransferase/spore coat polysaccharide biosynthesis protein SpsF (cytidylyltransferase family)